MLRADKNGGPALAIAFPITSVTADKLSRPTGERGEIDRVTLISLLHTGSSQLIQNG